MPKTAQSGHTIEMHENAARPCFTDLPYRALVYARTNGQTPLFWVANVEGGPWNAKNALQRAHKVHGGNCHYCKKQVSQGDLSIDHADPRTWGGQDAAQNLVVSHKGCNNEKGQKPIEVFNANAGREWLEALLLQVQDRLNRLG